MSSQGQSSGAHRTGRQYKAKMVMDTLNAAINKGASGNGSKEMFFNLDIQYKRAHKKRHEKDVDRFYANIDKAYILMTEDVNYLGEEYYNKFKSINSWDTEYFK